jgi:hypothetical protein
MKLIKIFNILLVTAVFSVITSCTKQDLFTEPTNSISDVDAYSNASRIDKSAVGMYDALQNANFFGGRILVYVDQRGLDANQNSFFGSMGAYTTLNANDVTVASAYQGGYRTIYTANLFYQSFLPNQSLVPVAKANQYIGESKFIRALCYFYLVNLWAQPYGYTADNSHLGVPLVLTAATDPFAPSNNLPRATVKQVYDQMEADLLDAEAKLPASYPDAFTQVARATQGSARALLARLYLYKGDYAKANTYADLVINSGKYALQPNIASVFNTYTTNESIFSVAMSGGDNPNTNNSLGQHYGINPGRGDVNITSDYISLMNTAVDKRYLNLTKLYSGTNWSLKYPGLTVDYVPVIRYAEVLLIKAEALARSAGSGVIDPTALALVQQVRDRSAGGLLTVATQQDLINAILKEKRIELAFEGHNYLDMQRTKQDLPAHGFVTTVIKYGNNLRVLPIPTYDIQKNPNLVQNPGY